MTFLIYLFVTSRNLLFGVILPRRIITILRKKADIFRQVSLKEVLLSVSILECFSEKVGSLKTLYCTRTSSQVIFRVSGRIFFHLFTFPLIYRSLFVFYIVHILCSCIHICKRYYFPLSLFLRWKAKEK